MAASHQKAIRGIMDRHKIADAAKDAEMALIHLKKANELGYCHSFKCHIGEAAYRLECAAETLRRMERGK